MIFNTPVFSKLMIASLFFTTLNISTLVQANEAIHIENFYARATPPSVTTSAFFAEISNNGNYDRVIVSAESPVAGKVELHDVILDGDVMKMRQIKQIKLLKERTTTLKPGSLHVMLFNLKQPLVKGNNIEITLNFANGEQKTLTAPVKKVMAGMKMKH